MLLAQTAGFVLTRDTAALVERIRAEAGRTAALSRSAAGSFTVEGAAGSPWPYQQAGIQYLVEKKRAFLADEMGLGKTMQALLAVQALAAWPACVVTLASCKGGWAAECGRWLPGVRVVQWEGRRAQS